MKEQMYRKISLKPQKDRSLLNFHPWVFSGAIQTDVKSFEEGSIVEVFNAAGNYLATGHFHHGTIMVRVISFEKCAIDSSFWIRKLTGAFELRQRIGLPSVSQTNAFRLVHGEGDGLPGLIIDIYDDAAVIQTHSAGMQLSVAEIAHALDSIAELPLTTIYHKSLDSGNETAGVWLKGNQRDTVVRENSNFYYVNWEEGQKTGFFLDQRDNRHLLGSYCKDKRVLNTFCYSGGFSVYALKAGAAHVDSVDSSRKAMEWTNKNVALNMGENAPHQSWCEDVFDFMKNHDQQHDVIVLDPPAFAKHLSAVDKATIGYRNLNQEAIRRIKKGGILFTFSCSQAIDKQLFRKIVFMAAAKTGRQVQVLHQLSQGSDHPVSIYHPEGEYLKGLVLRVC